LGQICRENLQRFVIASTFPVVIASGANEERGNPVAPPRLLRRYAPRNDRGKEIASADEIQPRNDRGKEIASA